MQVTAETLALLWNVITQTGDINEQGQPIPRSSYPAKHQKAKNSLKKKVFAVTEVATDGEGGLRWEANSDGFKPEEGRTVRDYRFAAGELELTEPEKQYAKWCASTREDIPDVSDAAIDGFRELTGHDLTQ